MKIKIPVDIYSIPVIFTTDFDTFKKLHKEADIEHPFITVDYNAAIYVYVSGEWGNFYDYRFIQCVSHEMTHAAMIILDKVGVHFDGHNQEPLCYLQDYLVSRVFKAIEKTKEHQK